ncbi:LytR C-terminal domain-containing protein [Hoyosella rhizosphaerae]|uniref:LytR/CpsA/Psr regulator C-terminal domain-containing protein n=1 Tax=Hoyosella rhizosphaerae TaxID=1755582 RepID=A0A916U643_9ACTN|nr:LytR C-terminal domain-containing protein [Hoyosella rhizosphaerae]MBN4927775.1 LytR C-terminal domain-containing protein [Hoyosella rhizosphaerae]GGC61628.1 hypothetical protein GCM10011410_12640 [Hoyosella rhizosphaerae]
MNSPQPGSNSLPLRSFAFMLLSAAVVFFVIGALVLRDSGTSADATASDSAVTATTTAIAPASDDDDHDSDDDADDADDADADDETEEDESDSETTSVLAPPPAPAVQVHVLNNSTVSGLAGRTADNLRGSGWQVGEVGNYSASALSATTVFYSNDAERQVAERVAANLGAQVAPRPVGLSGHSAGVVVVLTG